MKFYRSFDDGTEIEYEIEPLSYDKFCAICVTICVILFLLGLFAAIILRYWR